MTGRTSFIRAVLILALAPLMPGATVTAAESQPEQSSQSRSESAAEGGSEAPSAPATEQSGEDEAADSGTAEEPGVFVPTEEISEDFAVSFPVDI